MKENKKLVDKKFKSSKDIESLTKKYNSLSEDSNKIQNKKIQYLQDIEMCEFKISKL